MFERRWAFFRRLQYGSIVGLFFVIVFSSVYYKYLYAAPTCFDNSQNGSEHGVDCGGACSRICAFEVEQPKIAWARSFRVQDGLYNAVAYIENHNKIAASPEVKYTFSLHDAQGLIAERTGTTILPPDSSYPVFEARIDTQGRVPTQTFITLQPVTLWLPATAGRDQFTVTDRKLTGADSAPRLDAKITNNSLQKADKVEVIATIFDTKGNALTSSRTFIDNFAPRSEASAVFTWPEPIAKTVRSCEVPTDIILGIDLSGSMDSDSTNPPQPLTSVLQAATAFAGRLRPADRVGVVSFATDASVVLPLAPYTAGIADVIKKMSIAPKEQTGSTNTGAAFDVANSEINSARHNTGARKVMVLLTDGLATAPVKDPGIFAQTEAKKIQDTGVSVFTIGLGEKVDMNFVRSLASAPTQAFQAVSAAEVDQIYKTITSSLCEDGAAVIDIVPKSSAGFTPLQ